MTDRDATRPVDEPGHQDGKTSEPAAEPRRYRIGEAAERAGVSSRTLRWYEEIGLLSPVAHTSGGARRYGEDDLLRIEHIRELQGLLGLDLGEIRDILQGEDALAGLARPEIEHADGRRTPLRAEEWTRAVPGDGSILDRCKGHTLDVGSGPGRLTVALAERGVPALGIDVTPYAVWLARSSGALALRRDVFGTVPGTGRWATLLLADGNIGIGGDPGTLLRRVAELIMPGGQALGEVEPPVRPFCVSRYG